VSFRNISAWAIRNPVPPLVLFAALLLAGMLSFSRMSVNDSPEVDFPAAQINISQPGAAPSELETQVTQKVEAAIRGLNGIDEINSTIREGTSSTFIQFTIGTPTDRAINDIRDAISNIRGDLPEGILEPQVSRVDIGGDGELAFFSAASSAMSLEELSWYVDNTVGKRVRAIPGVAAFERVGGVDREIRVVLDPAKMQALGVTAGQVNAQLRSVNLNAAGGRAEIAGSEQSVRVLGNAEDAFALSQTNIQLSGGRSIKLADVATVTDGYAEQRAFSKMDGRQVLAFSIQRAKGASDVEVYNEFRKALDELHAKHPEVKFTELFTTVNYTLAQYRSAIVAMIEGAVLAVLVVWLFLRDWRATLISAIAIPLSAIPAFWFMDLMGFTLNFLSLLALSLVAGVLVDDAIVEIENIVRHMRMGKTAYQASIDAADEIGLAVLATTMSIVAVFLPVGLMPGLSGQFFKNFGLTIVAAVLVSLAVARLITPLAAAYFLKSHGHASHGEGRVMDMFMKALRWTLDTSKVVREPGATRMQRLWARRKDHRLWTVGIGGLSFLATIGMFWGIPLTFQPTQDNDFSQVRIFLPPGATLQRSAEISDRAVAILRQDPDVVTMLQRVNTGGGNIFITLRKDRSKTSVEFQRKWQRELSKIPDARVNFQSQSGGGPGSSGRDFTMTLGGDDPVLLNATANKIVEEMKGLPQLVAPRTAADLQRPEIIIRPRTQLAAELGVTTQALSQAIRIATIGDIDQNSAKFSLNDRQIVIRTQLGEVARRDLASIENLPVPTSTGGSVPLRTVADISFGSGPIVISRTNQVRRVSLGADFAEGLVSGDVTPLIDALPSVKNLPQGISRLTLGEAKWQAELLQSFVIAVVTGILLVFATLVLLYKRLLPPLVNMGSLLLAPLGGALALRITGDPISMPVLIGMLLLLGIVAKNSILLVDFALEEIDKGVDKFTAIMDAGHKRAQPIVMTTVAMVAGMIPVALSIGSDGSFRAPMGVTVIGGLLVSTVLTLLIVPATFSLAMGIESRLGPWMRRTFTNGGEGARAPQPAE
jgi:multidrug efflux pump subunit AcrB